MTYRNGGEGGHTHPVFFDILRYFKQNAMNRMDTGDFFRLAYFN
jgi:hypothetical protein